MSASERNGASPLASPPLRTDLLYRLWRDQEGDELTPEERAELDEYIGASEAAERNRDALGLKDLAGVMEGGDTEPKMLVPGLIVRADHHLVYGTKESGKTWRIMHAAAQLIRGGKTVVWVDKEMGSRNLAARMIALGVSPEDVRARFVYLEHPSMDLSSQSKVLWKELLREKKPDMVVFDAQTELLADAGLNENIGTDVARWSETYLTPARKLEAATVMIDHTGHTENGRAVASRQKGAAAKIELHVERTKDFGRDEVGQVTVKLTKNTVSAPIPKAQAYRIGGEGGQFVFEPDETGTDRKDATRIEKDRKIGAAIRETLLEHGSLSQNQLYKLAKAEAREVDVLRVAKDLADSTLSPIRSEPDGRSIRYSLAEPESERDGVSD